MQLIGISLYSVHVPSITQSFEALHLSAVMHQVFLAGGALLCVVNHRFISLYKSLSLSFSLLKVISCRFDTSNS